MVWWRLCTEGAEGTPNAMNGYIALNEILFDDAKQLPDLDRVPVSMGDSASYTQPNAPLPSTPPVNSYLTPPKTTDWLASKPACTPRSSQLILGAPVAAMPTASALPCAGPAAPRLASQLGQHLYWIYERPATQIRQNTIASRDSATA